MLLGRPGKLEVLGVAERDVRGEIRRETQHTVVVGRGQTDELDAVGGQVAHPGARDVPWQHTDPRLIVNGSVVPLEMKGGRSHEAS
ncbi:hypothetical protein [Streptomyces malaysiensis]|uniref:Uncharacterized protein n=1 Tax=Streptomyces malaysiensis subsp. samsunensis TaxID=459658 RepID=A0A9X2M4C2_STRMQ|nr:hypothetical protein [Streptomyces samsunensis]MCQ8836240.1 hypothetical protein [Streptomyces samsunensis]